MYYQLRLRRYKLIQHQQSFATYNSSTETTESNAELSVAEVECAEVTCELGPAVVEVTTVVVT